MKLASLLAVLVLAAGSAAQMPSAPATTPEVATPDRANIAGWYQVAPHEKALVVWGPTGGYRLLDFDAAHFHRLDATDDGYRVAGSGPWENAAVTFERDAEGGSAALVLAAGDQAPLRFPRAQEVPFDLQEVRFRNGDTELAGLLLIPRVRKLVGETGHALHEVPLPLPGVVVIHGSGDSDRDNVWAMTFAQEAARAGFVTLFPDKRGSGASGGDWHTTGLDGLGDDALAGVAFLRNDARVDPGRVGLLGLSQGGVVAPLAAARSDDVAFVVSLSSGAVTLFDAMRHELVQDLKRAGVPAEGIDAITRTGELGLAYSRSLDDAAWDRYTAALATLREGPYADAADALPGSRDDWHWAWWHRVGEVDPLPAWQALDRPALAVFGEDDETDNVPVHESVRRLREALQPETHPQYKIRVYPGLGHTLVDAGRGWVDRGVLSDLAGWLLDAVGGLDPTRTAN